MRNILSKRKYCRIFRVLSFVLAIVMLVQFAGASSVSAANPTPAVSSNKATTVEKVVTTTNPPDTHPITVRGTGADIIAEAYKYVGNPYVYGGTSLTHGCDCSSYVSHILGNTGYLSPKYGSGDHTLTSGDFYTRAAEYGGKIVVSGVPKDFSALIAGDIVVWDGHVALYDGQGMIYEAQSTKAGITHNRTLAQALRGHHTFLGVVRVTDGGPSYASGNGGANGGTKTGWYCASSNVIIRFLVWLFFHWLPGFSLDGNSGGTGTNNTTGTGGTTVVIDAGHGGTALSGTEPIAPGSSEQKVKVTSGTDGSHGKAEHTVNLEIALKLQKIMEQKGYKVIMTRTSDNQNLSNIDRANIANNANADCIVRIHCNSSTSSSAHGVEAYYPGTKYANNNGYCTTDIINKSKSLSSALVDGVAASTTLKKNGAYSEDQSGLSLTGCHWTKVPVSYLEVGYMSNSSDDAYICSDAGQNKIAEGAANGLVQFLGPPKSGSVANGQKDQNGIDVVPYINQGRGLYNNGSWQHTDWPGRIVHGEGTLQKLGCGFCSTAMAMSYFKGTIVSPFDINANRTSQSFCNWANANGVTAHVTASWDEAYAAVKAGYPVMFLARNKYGHRIGNPNHGYWTNEGHFVLMIGVKSDGTVAVNDPGWAQNTYWTGNGITHAPEYIYKNADSYVIFGK